MLLSRELGIEALGAPSCWPAYGHQQGPEVPNQLKNKSITLAGADTVMLRGL